MGRVVMRNVADLFSLAFSVFGLTGREEEGSAAIVEKGAWCPILEVFYCEAFQREAREKPRAFVN